MADPKDARSRAEATFKARETRAAEGSKAKAEYDAAGKAMRDKTVRLRAERLEREEAAKSESAKSKPAKRRSAKSALR